MTLLDIKKVVYAVRLELKFHLSPRVDRCTVSLCFVFHMSQQRQMDQASLFIIWEIVCYQTHVEMAGSFTWETS